jgi:hypothetical protein
LSLAQIHAALAYYFDHKAEMDALIKKEDEDYRVLRKAAVESPFARRMRAEGRLP